MSKDSCKGKFSCSMQLCHCQVAVVLSKRVQEDADTDKKQRSCQGFQLAVTLRCCSRYWCGAATGETMGATRRATSGHTSGECCDSIFRTH